MIQFLLITFSFMAITSTGVSQSMNEIRASLSHIKYVHYDVPAVFTKDSCPSEPFVFPEGLEIPEKYRCQFGLAFKYYPELRNAKIEFQFKHVSTTLQAQPIIASLFGKQVRYKIIVNDDPEFEGILFDSIPFNGQVGIIAHELAHILDYTNKTRCGIISTGFKYLFKGYKRRYEKSIDYLVILKGLGWQLYDWAHFAMIDSKATKEYKQFKMDYYLESEEIEQIIAQEKKNK